MNDKEQVRNAGIRSAIIIDDGYDEVPKVSELIDEGAWDSLFDDAQGDKAGRIVELFDGYHPDDRELKSNQEFIEALWNGREKIPDLLGDLFDDYELKIQENRSFLDEVEAVLSLLGISFKRCGRDFVETSVDADLIIIDLYLGIQQGPDDRELTVNLLKEAFIRRRDRLLPSIILMSQVSRVDSLAKKFRQDVQLHASAFRHIRKNDLSKSGKLKGLILTLATHRKDSQALATFVETWEDKAIEAVHAAAGALRKIDLDDLQHIRRMLLRFEGLNTSSYMLDVFDRVLQHEIESHNAVLKAAHPLDGIPDDPAPLMISNDRDTYAVLEQTLFVNPKRRAHATGAEWPINFGDILGPKPGIQVNSRRLFSGNPDLVFFVASPECDLIRKDGLRTALLMAGSLKKIDMTKPGLAVTEKTTPVVTLKGGKRYQVDWDFGNLRTINLAQAKRMVHQNSGFVSVVARLREGPALNLRQHLLSNIGRVAELAPLPRSFTFHADLYLPIQSGDIRPLEIPGGVEITGNILVPRRANFAAAIFDSHYEQELTSALLGLCLEKVAPKSRASLEILKEQTRIRQIFRTGLEGIDLPLSKPRGAGLRKLSEKPPDSDEKKPKIDKVATILTGNDIKTELGAELRGAGLIVRIHSDGVE